MDTTQSDNNYTARAVASWYTADINSKQTYKYPQSQPHHATTVLRPFFRDRPGEPVPEQNFWTLWCMGRLTEADISAIQLGATPSGLTIPPYFLQAGCPSCRPTNSVKPLKVTSAFGLGRRRYSSPQLCYLHHLHTLKYPQTDTQTNIQADIQTIIINDVTLEKPATNVSLNSEQLHCR